MARTAEDRFSNIASGSVTESGANVLTFTELQTGIGLGQGIGMLIDQLDYYPSDNALADLVAAGDSLNMGWTVNNTVASINPDVSGVIHQCRLSVEPVIGSAASGGSPFLVPMVFQFFPPMIIAAPRIYMAVQGNSLAAASVVRFRMYFRYLPLSAQDYLELAEAFVLVG